MQLGGKSSSVFTIDSQFLACDCVKTSLIVHMTFRSPHVTVV